VLVFLGKGHQPGCRSETRGDSHSGGSSDESVCCSGMGRRSCLPSCFSQSFTHVTARPGLPWPYPAERLWAWAQGLPRPRSDYPTASPLPWSLHGQCHLCEGLVGGLLIGNQRSMEAHKYVPKVAVDIREYTDHTLPACFRARPCIVMCA
jgi:hypothetical protein